MKTPPIFSPLENFEYKEANRQSINDRYQKRLRSIPAPGSGCHVSLLGVANLGIMAGKTHEHIFSDIRQAIPHGRRKVSNREIQDAIQRASRDHQPGSSVIPLKTRPIVQDGKEALRRIIDQGGTCTEVDLWGVSPIRIEWAPEEDTICFLSVIYDPDDLIFIGGAKESGVVGRNIRTSAKWIEFFKAGGKTCPHFIPNPLTGLAAPKKSGEGKTYRGDGNIKTFRFAVVEFDNIPLDDQVRFWAAVKLPIYALIHSGGKSIHGLIDVQKLAQVKNVGQWDEKIRAHLYERLLTPLGVDGACANPARLSRLPGHFREETGKFQKLLFLSS
jgi:hypothetical protein